MHSNTYLNTFKCKKETGQHAHAEGEHTQMFTQTHNLQNPSPKQDLTRHLARPHLPCEKMLLGPRERCLFFFLINLICALGSV